MQYFDIALRAARSAQEHIKDVLNQAVHAQAYAEVAKIAALAERLAVALAPEPDMSDAATTTVSKPTERNAAADRASMEHARKSSIERTGALTSVRRRSTGMGKAAAAGKASRVGLKTVPEGYPRFEREADRLVKVGWSSRDKRGYEHRASKSVIFAFADQLRSQNRSPFSMDDVLPIKDEQGAELPSYQAYLAVGWLRSVGAVRKVGKDGYSVDPVLVSSEALERFWQSLPTR